MLDTPTKKRIDDCRDILVGKLPDPKAQIEQITIGLIYKFMDDMDKEAIELGGKAKFFSNYNIPDPANLGKEVTVEFEKYSWDRLFDAKVTASEMLTLYAEAIAGMDKNPNIPQLFRDIFKNAFLPYRDPETLKMFLKTISEFEYTHSEKLGDAFEYLLSVMGSQGDAGQFRTPRHIIDFLVAVVNPGKTDTILDPACGTAGFLISAFKYIMGGDNNGCDGKDTRSGVLTTNTTITPDERRRIIGNFTGYDISPDMVRLSLVNLYLHGFSDPHIWEYDTLSSEERWDETFDVILANPPFMSPKGGIRPHKKFSIGSNRSEVLFVDYIAEHLNPKGRAGIIVPEGVIFQSGTAYKALRKMLVDNYLYAVVSLPAGIFNPYSGVKTSILLMDKQLAKQTDEILFVKIDNDGYGLGAQRNAVKGGQLDEAVELIMNYKLKIINEPHAEPEPGIAHAVLKTEIAKNGDYNLSGERYKTLKPYVGEWELVELYEVCEELYAGGDAPKECSKTKTKEYYIPIYSNGIGQNSLYGYSNHSRVEKDAVTISARGTIGYTSIRRAPFFPIVRLIVAIPKTEIIDLLYLKLILESLNIYRNGNSIPQLTIPMIKGEKIPLPPLSVQQEIVAEIEGYQKIIDGAKMVVENYRPKIEIDPEWEMVQLGDVCESISDGDHQPPPKSEEGVPFVTITNININEGIDFSNTYFVSQSYFDNIKPHRKPQMGDILYTVTGSFGIPILIDFEKEFCFQRHIGLIRPNSKVANTYLYYYLLSPDAFSQATKTATGMAQKTVSLNSLRSFTLPLPPLETQHRIVAQIEKEQELVNSNKQLIAIFEQKIKDRIAKVWGGSTELTTGSSTENLNTENLQIAAEPAAEYSKIRIK